MSKLERSSSGAHNEIIQLMEETHASLLKKFNDEINEYPHLEKARYKVRKIVGSAVHGSITLFKGGLGFTAAHVVEELGLRGATILPHDGIDTTSARISSALTTKNGSGSWKDDFAVVAIEGSASHSFARVASPKRESGMAFMVGYPAYDKFSVTDNSMEPATVVPVTINEESQTTIVINPIYEWLDFAGVSGGALINETGELMGVAVGGRQDKNFGLCVPIKRIIDSIPVENLAK